MLFKNQFRFITIFFSWSICFGLANLTKEDLQGPWLKPGETLSTQSFQRLINVAELNPNVNLLLKDLASRLGFPSPQHLINLIQVMQGPQTQGNMDPYQAGITKFDTSDFAVTFFGNDTNSTSKLKPLVSEHGTAFQYTKNEMKETLGIQSGFDVTGICIINNLSLLDTFLTLIHEVTHAAGTLEHFKKTDSLDYFTSLSQAKDIEDHTKKTLRNPGGEANAYFNEIWTYIQLLKNPVVVDVPTQISPVFFDERGQELSLLEAQNRDSFGKTVIKKLPSELYFDKKGQLINKTKFFDYIENRLGYLAEVSKKQQEELLPNQLNNINNYILIFDRRLNELSYNQSAFATQQKKEIREIRVNLHSKRCQIFKNFRMALTEEAQYEMEQLCKEESTVSRVLLTNQ